MKNLFKTVIFALCFVLVQGCGCNYHMKKIRGKCEFKSDTVRIVDTITIHSSSVDTLFHFNSTSDTIVLRENGVIVKYFYNTKDSTVYLKGEREEVKVPYVKTVIKNVYRTDLPWWVNWLKKFLFVIVLLIAGAYLFTRLKPWFVNKIRANDKP